MMVSDNDRMKQRREEEKITNKWERLEIEIKKKLD
jgi:hypothetical protein